MRDNGGRGGICHYCQGAGRWKDQCPVLRSRSKRKSYPPAPAPALSCSTTQGAGPEFVGSDSDDFKPFIAQAVVSF